MSNDLRSALRAEANRLADEFYDKAMSLLSAEVSGMFGGQSGKPQGAAKVAPKRTAEETEAVLALIIAALKAKPEGIRLEGLRKELGLDKNTVVRAIKMGLESDQLTKTGQKRATTYRLPGARKGRAR